MLKDLKLDKNTHELVIENGDLQFVTGLDYIAQKLKIKLLYFFGEGFLNTTIGIKYHEVVFVKNPNITLLDSLYKLAISEVPGFIELLEYDSDFDIPNRSFTLSFKALTDSGLLIFNDEEFTI